MQDIEAMTERILLIGRGRILLDGSLGELKKRFSGRKTLVIEYSGSAPDIRDGMALLEAREGRLAIALDPAVLPVSDAIARLAAQTDLLDVSVSGVSSEEMVAALYSEYEI
jgi:ABC-2 type transport system ATP-binding protein